jgi:hypothetical protein
MILWLRNGLNVLRKNEKKIKIKICLDPRANHVLQLLAVLRSWTNFFPNAAEIDDLWLVSSIRRIASQVLIHFKFKHDH